MTTRIDGPQTTTTVGEPATRWTQLDSELRMLCRGLCYPSGWTPEGVTTFVGLPGDAEYAQAIAAICRRLAGEFGLEQTVVRQGDRWRVRFARPVATAPALAWWARPVPGGEEDVVRPVAVGMRAALRRFAVAWHFRPTSGKC